MKASFQAIFEPFALPCGVRLKNRISMAPMTISAANSDGSVSEDDLHYYSRRARRVGMVITASTTISAQGGFPGSGAIDRDEMIPGLSRLASTIKEHGAKAVLQIVHGGRQCPPSNGDVVSASAVPMEKEGAVVPRELQGDEIVDIVHAFGEATRRAIEAGFDGVEIHGANGFLIQQFFSPHSNRREDRWGGTLEKRMTFPLAVVDKVHRIVRQYAKEPFIVGYRLSPEEAETPGITMAETLPFVEALAAKPLDYLHISLNDFWSVPRRGIDDNRPRIQIIQERIGHLVPVMGVGAIRTAQDAARALQTGVPLIALGRELIMEPDWIEKIAEGREDEIKTSISRGDQNRLAIPDSLWRMISGVPGWFPIDQGNPD
ncbi:NADH-dependent flavin oxidoreductase [Brevibacillus borstelensis]|uniref:NADH-dependent flavin oxidoreductase n=1 Tax=Brevibacillus borstelensis TaxID=45462 RepID=UPI0030BF52A0